MLFQTKYLIKLTITKQFMQKCLRAKLSTCAKVSSCKSIFVQFCALVQFCTCKFDSYSLSYNIFI